MSERFYISTPITGETAALAGTEAHHLTHVLRAKAGDTVILFDGSGSEFTAKISKTSKQGVELSIEQRRTVDCESPIALTLAVALPKGDRQRWLVEKAVELGVAKIVPLMTQRGVARPVEAALARLHRAVIEASKQCGRNRLMQIARPASIVDLIRDATAAGPRFVAHPGGLPLPAAWAAAAVSGDIQTALVAIGPEGGFSDAEVEQLLAAGWEHISLGSSILRIETAAIAVAAWLRLSAEASCPE